MGDISVSYRLERQEENKDNNKGEKNKDNNKKEEYKDNNK